MSEETTNYYFYIETKNSRVSQCGVKARSEIVARKLVEDTYSCKINSIVKGNSYPPEYNDEAPTIEMTMFS